MKTATDVELLRLLDALRQQRGGEELIGDLQ